MSRIALWAAVGILGLAPLLVAGLATAEPAGRETVTGPDGTALAMALRAAGVLTGTHYDVDGAWKALDASRFDCADLDLVRHASCTFVDERGYPDRSRSVQRQGARDLLAALLAVRLVSARFPEGVEAQVERIACLKWYEDTDFACTVDVRGR